MEKKKIKDLTLREMNEICKKQKCDSTCVLRSDSGCAKGWLIAQLALGEEMFTDEELNKEIEVEE